MIVETLLKISMLGASWVLYLLLFLSVVSFGAMLERFLFFRKNGAEGKALDDAIAKALRRDDYSAAVRALEGSSSLEASILKDALVWKHGGPAAVNDALDSALGRAKEDLDRGANLLGTLGNNAPFIGLFGTVIGVIEAFSHLGTSAQGSGMAKVMGGIAEALIATGVGIFVAIPAVVAYNIIQKKAGDIEGHAQSLSRLFTAWMHTHPESQGEVESRREHEPATERAVADTRLARVVLSEAE